MTTDRQRLLQYGLRKHRGIAYLPRLLAVLTHDVGLAPSDYALVDLSETDVLTETYATLRATGTVNEVRSTDPEEIKIAVAAFAARYIGATVYLLTLHSEYYGAVQLATHRLPVVALALTTPDQDEVRVVSTNRHAGLFLFAEQGRDRSTYVLLTYYYNAKSLVVA